MMMSLATDAAGAPAPQPLRPQPANPLDAVIGAPVALANIAVTAVTTLLTSILAPGPTTPAPPMMLFVVLGWVQRELQRTFANHTPTAVIDEVTTSEDTDVTFDVLANDIDADAGDGLTVTDYTQPANGTVVLNADGTFTYTPNTDFDGTDNFTYTVSDEASPWHLHGLGGFFFGGGHTSTTTVTITVSAVDDPLTVTTSEGATVYTENDGDTPVVVDPSLTVSDPDSTITSATVTITNPQSGDKLSWTPPLGSTIAIDPTSTDTALKLTGTASVAEYQTALRAITFASPGDNPTAGDRTITFTVETTTASEADAKTITVVAVDDPPTVTASGGATTYTENAANTPVVVDANLTVADPDSSITGAAITITNAQPGDQLSWTQPLGSPISLQSSTGTVIVLTGTGTPADYEAALRNITFSSPGLFPTAGDRTIEFSVTTTDGNDSSTKTVTVVAAESGVNAVALGYNGNGQTDIPPLPPNVTYTQVAAGGSKTVLLRSDGTVVAAGNSGGGQTDIPALPPGVIYTQVAAGANNTVLLRSDGTAIAIGYNDDGQTDIPALPPGVKYVQVAAGGAHTVLLRDDGTAVAVGWNGNGQTDIPALPPGVKYIQVAAGERHTVLLRDDGVAVAVGQSLFGQLDIPALPPGLKYTQVAAGGSHTVLLRDDGAVVVAGSNTMGQITIPPLPPNVTYTQVVAGMYNTVLLRSDGVAVAVGNNTDGQNNIPALPDGISYTHIAAGLYHIVLLTSDVV